METYLFSDYKLKKLGYRYVHTNLYRYTLILNKLIDYIGINNKCIDFGSYSGEDFIQI